MRNIIFFALFLACSAVYAEENEVYIVDLPDGGVSVVYYFPGSEDTIEDVLKSQGKGGYPFRRLQGALPAREDRDAWVRKGKKIVVDIDKKEEKVAEREKRKADKAAALAKLKISEKELKDALGK